MLQILESWKKSAACRAADPYLFDLIDKDHPQYTGEWADDAKQMDENFTVAAGYCSNCPVIKECLASSLPLDRQVTFRGGLVPEGFEQLAEKAALRREQQKAKREREEKAADKVARTCEAGHVRRDVDKPCSQCERRDRERRTAARRAENEVTSEYWNSMRGPCKNGHLNRWTNGDCGTCTLERRKRKRNGEKIRRAMMEE